jgi:hypothetical protein
MYGPAFKNKLSDEALREKVLTMSNGQAAAPVSEQKRELIVDFLRSLRDSRPYCNILMSGSGSDFSGEALPGSKLWVSDGTNRIDVPLEGYTWRVKSAEIPASSTAILHIEKGGSEITVPLNQPASEKR